MKLRNKALLLSVMAISGVGLGVSKSTLAQEGSVVIKPSSAWAVTKVSQGADPYCTLVRQYEGGTVLTLGQNLDEEYSIAIDFQKPKFDPEKSYPLTLQPGPGQLRAYEMIPASPSAMVVRLGWDDSFLAALADSQLLKADIDKEEFNFGFPDFATGEKDLAACMEALKNPDAPVVASAKVEEKKPVFSAKKVETKKVEAVKAEPIDIKPVEKKVEAVKPAAEKIVKKVEPVQVAPAKVAVAEVKPEPVPVKVPVVKAPAAKVDTKELNKMASALSSAQQEKRKLEEALNKERLLREALTREKQEYESLKQKDSEQSAAVQANQKIMAEKIDALMKQVDAANAENESLKKSVAEKDKLVLESKKQGEAKAQNTVENEAENMKVRSDLAAALAEKEALLAELADAKTKLIEKNVPNPKTAEEIAALKKELESAKEQVAEKEKMAADVAQKQAGDKEAEKALQEKMAALEARAKKLELENKKFYEDAKLARSQVDNAKIELGTQTLQKVKKLETKLEAAMADNISLTKQVEELSRMQDEVSVGLADGDWNLEKATRRYNQAEKEVRRLGALLEQQRGSFRSEAKELEEMLFDPAVASEAQRRKLAELEIELAEAKRKLARTGTATQERVISGSQRASSIAPMPSVAAKPVERVSMTPPAVEKKIIEPRVSPKPVAKKSTAPKASPSTSTFGQSDIQKIIAGSGIGAGTVTSAGGNTYRWNAQNVTGFAQIVPKTQAGDVVQFAQNYITKQRARCQGDFASVPGDVGGGKATYEIACVGGNTSTSSSLVFFEKQGDVAMISHQASAEDMDSAMDARDKVVSQIR